MRPFAAAARRRGGALEECLHGSAEEEEEEEGASSLKYTYGRRPGLAKSAAMLQFAAHF